MIGQSEPWSHEKLCPLLGLYRAADFTDALRQATELVEYGGVGHTASLFTSEGDPLNRSLAVQRSTGVMSTIVNEPSAQGGE